MSSNHLTPEFAQTHVHWISGAIQPSHPLSLPLPPALNLSQYQALFQRVSSSHQVAKVLELQFQHQSFQGTFRVGFHLWYYSVDEVQDNFEPNDILPWRLIKPCGSLPSILGFSLAVSRLVKINFLLKKHWCILPNRLPLIITVKVKVTQSCLTLSNKMQIQTDNRDFPIAQWVKNPSAMQETHEVWVDSCVRKIL